MTKTPSRRTQRIRAECQAGSRRVAPGQGGSHRRPCALAGDPIRLLQILARATAERLHAGKAELARG